MPDFVHESLIPFLLLSAIGWILVIAAVGMRRRWRKREEIERARTSGTIAGDPEEKPVRDRRRRRPVVEFTAEGHEYRLEYPKKEDPAVYPAGAPVEVLYDPDDPTHFHLEDDQAEMRSRRIRLYVGLAWILISALALPALSFLAHGGLPDTAQRLRRGAHGIVSGYDGGNSTLVEGPYTYETRDGAAAVLTGCRSDQETLMLPVVLGGRVVTSVGPVAFVRCLRLREVIVPGNIGIIEPGAFSGCLSLKRVTLLDGVRSIGIQAFDFCGALEDVTLPASVTSIGKDAFPGDCAAVFHVVPGSEAERWCTEMGFAVDAQWAPASIPGREAGQERLSDAKHNGRFKTGS